MLETFSKSSSERVPSECKHCRLTSDIFTKEFFTSRQPIYLLMIYISRDTENLGNLGLVQDWLSNIILRSELNERRSKEESKSKLKVMLEIG